VSAPARHVRKVPFLTRRWGQAVLLVVLVMACLTSSLMAQGPRDFRSKNFLIHTDLSEDEAKQLLNELETMLSLISRYWGKPNRQTIEMYVAKDIRSWPRSVLQQMDPEGLKSIAGGGGVTMGVTTSAGGQRYTKSTVYCTAERGVPKHEAVHAYCQQTFGTTGPLWYSEGMAEMGQYWRSDDSSVNCEDYVLDYLRRVQPKSLNDIVNPTVEVSGDSWQNYAWRWALCHLLANNTNYQARFRPLGLAYLTNQNVTFEQVYGPMASEIIFEYLFFLNHMERGYRVDLCSWDWTARFTRLLPGRATKAKVKAAAGWQPSRMLLEAGQKYDFSASGQWKLSKDGEALTAAGAADGSGKLVGVIFKDYKLSEPFELGDYGTFVAPESGQLWLRCRDRWGSLADNEGEIEVTLKVYGAGEQLARPSQRLPYNSSMSMNATAGSTASSGAASSSMSVASTTAAAEPAAPATAKSTTGSASDEAKAASKLRQGKLLLSRDVERAKTYLQEAIDLAPNAPTAAEARKLLQGL